MTVALNAEGIPADLREWPHWLLWRLEVRDGKPTKVPVSPLNLQICDATDPANTAPLDVALAAAGSYDGVGLAMVEGCPFSGLDLDKCIDDDGAVAPWALGYVARLDSYTEVTPSGRGLRVWVRGKLPPGRRRKGPVEFYDSGRYFTVTGAWLPGTPAAVAERTGELAGLHAEVFTAPGRLDPPGAHREPPKLLLTDEELLRKAFSAKNGGAVEALFRGDTAKYGGDDSSADLALCSHLAFWFGGDVDAIDRVFRRSGLYRDKWERADYRDKTIGKALERGSFYDPGFRANGNGHGALANGAPGNGRADGGGIGGAGAVAAGQDDSDVREPFDDPHRLARVYLEGLRGRQELPTLVYWREEWHRWDGRAWAVCPDREVAAEMTTTIKAEFDAVARRLGVPVKPVTTKAVGNATQALRGLALLPVSRCPEQPAWIGTAEPGEDLPPAREVLPAANALVHLPSFVAGDDCTTAPTPRFFSPMNLGYDFDPGAGEPTAFLEFLRSVWPDDPESVEALQEWFGYLLMPDTSLQKILMLIGPKRSGKGTIVRLLRALVGYGNVTAPTLSGLATNFGMAPLIGKSVAVVADARLSGRTDAQVIVERLLSISGEDAQTIDRKHLDAWTGRLTTRFVLVSNELPRLGDASGALASRMVVLKMTRSFLGREDTTLEARLMAERPAVLLWAVAGWARLKARGRFVQPASGRDLADDFEELSSPISGFIEERCDVGPAESVAVQSLYEEWVSYCKAHGRDHPGDVAGFGRMLNAAVPALKVARPRRGEGRVREYHGIGLRIGIPRAEPVSANGRDRAF